MQVLRRAYSRSVVIIPTSLPSMDFGRPLCLLDILSFCALTVGPPASRVKIYSHPDLKEIRSMHRSVGFSIALIVLLIVSGIPPSSYARQATVKEEKQVFRTYPFSDPDPVARMTNIYPYFRFEGYSILPVRPRMERCYAGKSLHQSSDNAGDWREDTWGDREIDGETVHLFQPGCEIPGNRDRAVPGRQAGSNSILAISVIRRRPQRLLITKHARTRMGASAASLGPSIFRPELNGEWRFAYRKIKPISKRSRSGTTRRTSTPPFTTG